MNMEVALHPRARKTASRLQREATEVAAAIALVAGRSDYRVLLCGLHYGGRLAASCAGEAAAAGVRLETIRRDGRGIDIRVCRV